MQLKSWARKTLMGLAVQSDLKWRTPPVFEVLPAIGDSCVYYLCPSGTEPSGGVRVIYRHVDTLNSMGIRAAVLHDQDGFRCGWFENKTRIQDLASLRFHANDIIVVPECYGHGMQFLPNDARKIIFNQNAHHTFDQIPLERTLANPLLSGIENVLSIMTVSEDNAELLQYAFPNIPVKLVRNVVDEAVFYPDEEVVRRQVIAYVPTRRSHELEQFLHVMGSAGVASRLGWEFTPITGMSELEVSARLRKTKIFVSLSEHEGFGLPAAEAMASGCYVVGYAGGGGREFFDPA